jgi:hypothetical protein
VRYVNVAVEIPVSEIERWSITIHHQGGRFPLSNHHEGGRFSPVRVWYNHDERDTVAEAIGQLEIEERNMGKALTAI